MALQGVPRGQAAGPGHVDVGLQVLHLAGRHRFAQANRLAQRADVHQEIVHRRFDVDASSAAGRIECRSTRRRPRSSAGGFWISSGSTKRTFNSPALLVDEQPQEPLAVAVQAADGLLLPLAPLVPLAEILEHLAAVVEHPLAGPHRIPRQHVVGVPAAHGIGYAVAGGADGVRVRLGEDPRAGPDLPQFDLVDVGEGRRAG